MPANDEMLRRIHDSTDLILLVGYSHVSSTSCCTDESENGCFSILGALTGRERKIESGIKRKRRERERVRIGMEAPGGVGGTWEERSTDEVEDGEIFLATVFWDFLTSAIFINPFPDFLMALGRPFGH